MPALRFFFILLLPAVLVAEVEQLTYQVLEDIDRSKKGYTQGFFIKDGKLYESTGGYGSSLVRRFDLHTQEVELSKPLPADYFGEGIAAFGEDEMLQLTWRKGVGIVYDRESISFKRIFRYGTEGWGITTQGDQIVMSDGTDKLHFLNSETFQKEQELLVTKDGEKLEHLNELEWVGEHIYANIWLTDEIVKIDSTTGNVVATIDCKGLFKKRPKLKDAVLNGIAYDAKEEVFYLTGKTWSKMFKVKFVKIPEE